MTSHTKLRWALLVAANAVGWCMLSFHQSSSAAPRPNNEPFANAVQQRQEMIGHLKEISEQLKTQNALLASGNLKVIVTNEKKP